MLRSTLRRKPSASSYTQLGLEQHATVLHECTYGMSCQVRSGARVSDKEYSVICDEVDSTASGRRPAEGMAGGDRRRYRVVTSTPDGG